MIYRLTLYDEGYSVVYQADEEIEHSLYRTVGKILAELGYPSGFTILYLYISQQGRTPFRDANGRRYKISWQGSDAHLYVNLLFPIETQPA